MVCVILVFYSADDLNKNILLTIKPLNTILPFSVHCNFFLVWIHDDIHAAIQRTTYRLFRRIFF